MNVKEIRLNQELAVHHKKKNILEMLLASHKQSKRDCYIPSKNMAICDNYEVVGSPNISSTIFDAINFGYRNCVESENEFTFGGVSFSKEQIPQVDENRCLEIKAENNVVTFHTGSYYKFADKNGNYHVLSCAYGNVRQLYSDTCRGIIDDMSYNVGKFWNMLSQNGTYMSLYYSHDIQKQILNNAGISEGFFTVQIDSKKAEYYYSNGNCGVAISKSRYDANYNRLMSGNSVLNDFKAGSVFKIAGKEYVLGDDKKLDIPYGVDIFNIEYPSRHYTNW